MTTNGAKRALLIGIDRYPYLRPLDGCVNDVHLMRAVLEEPFGFPAENITLIANEQATQEAIRRELDALVDRTLPDDIVVIHFAGHGSQMTDREQDEASGYDNTIMPFDSQGWQGDNRDITDDEIHLRLRALARKTPYITLIFDSCHSGTITRDAFGAKSRGIEPDRRSIDKLPPSPIPAAERALLKDAGTGEGPSGWLPLSESYVLVAGCRDEESSYEYKATEDGGETPHGALTWFLCSELRQASSGTTYRDVFERAAANVTAYSGQHPQLEGRIDREVFGVRDITPVRHVNVKHRDGNTVTLAAGAALGMTKGSRWAIYPQGTKEANDTDLLGEVVITAVRATTSSATVQSERVASAIGLNARAVELEHAYGDFRLAVQLGVDPADPARAVMSEQLAASPLLRVVDHTTPAAARVYLLQPRSRVNADDPVPQLGPIAEPCWVAVGETGQTLGPPKRIGDVQAIRHNLETVARYRHALGLENPKANALRGKVKFELLRQVTPGTWDIAVPNTAGGQVAFEEGEQVAFRVTNDGDKPVYVSILDFSLSGEIGVVHPPPGARERINPGITFEIGSDPTRELIRLAAEQNPITDVETFKLIATSDEADFSFLEQKGVRSVSSVSPLMQLWETATGTANTRGFLREKPVDLETWATVVRPFVLRAPSSTTGTT